MGAYILITVLLFWSTVAFTVGTILVEDAVDAYAEIDPVYGNLALHTIWLTAACLIALPRICFDALTHYFTVTLRR
ncbi:MAG: hypothetical protein IJ438_09905 [Clostridia bacterium]|nr:hypothetical protein [Clostridia bacterium]